MEGFQHLYTVETETWKQYAGCVCGLHICVLCMGLFPPASTHSQLADWLKTDLHLIIHWVSVGSCFCLLILSFTYNRHVLFTNRIQNSRRFIMLLRCVLTNAGSRLHWLTQCRLLPRLEHTACPATRGTHTHTFNETKVTFSFVIRMQFGQIIQASVLFEVEIVILPIGINWWNKDILCLTSANKCPKQAYKLAPLLS